MHILKFADHHLIARNQLRMGAFLPNLVRIWLMPGAIEPELVKEPFAMLTRDLLQNSLRGKAFQISDARR